MAEKLCFIHIPKCGGTSLNDGLRKAVGINKYSPRYFKLSSSQTRKQVEKSGQDLLSLRKDILIKKFESGKLRYITGHLRCTEDIRAMYSPEWKFITVLRNPVKRWISQYFFNVHKKSDHFKITMSLEEYLRTDDAVKIGSQYIDFFTDGENLRSQASIDQTIDTLDHYDLVGILEHLDHFKNEFRENFGRELIIEKKNKNPLSAKEIKHQVSDEQLGQIEEICKPDMAVYSHFLSKIKS